MAALALMSAACAGDMSRFSAGNPFSNPFASSTPSNVDPTPTGSVPARPVASAPAASAPLPAPTSPATSGQNIVNRAGAGTNAVVTGYNANGWTTQGGSAVTLAQGETVNALSNRYGVPAEAIYRANGLAPGGAVAPGTRLTIPVYRGGATTAAAAPAEPAAKPTPPKAVPVAAAPAPKPVKPAPADKTPKPAKKPEKVAAVKPEPAKPQPVKAKPETAGGPTPKAAQAKPDSFKPAPKAAETKPIKPAPTVAETQPAKPAPKAEGAAPASANETKIVRGDKPDPSTTGSVASGADFRWPARGRIISGFRNNGNDGINIAVPEGTPVKAADEGTVAYAGSELKGYGNLVLLRHANGYVSAYAHNGELKVKKGDAVKRGQTIATSGQSGNVSSPQLHFEIRRGATPVDPTGYLN